MDELKNQLLQLRKEIEILVDEIQITIMKLNEFKKAMNIFYEINNDILNNYEMKNRNYEILENIKLISNNEIFKRLKKIDKMTDYKEKLFSIIDLYNKISSYDEDSQNINMGNEISTIKIEKQKKSKNKSTKQSSFDSFENAFNCKVVFLGDYDTGITKLIASFISFEKDEAPFYSTIGCSYSAKTMLFNEENQSIRFEIWNTLGVEKYRALTRLYFRDTSVCILVYDITRKESFDEIRNHRIHQVKEFAPKDISKKNIYI